MRCKILFDKEDVFLHGSPGTALQRKLVLRGVCFLWRGWGGDSKAIMILSQQWACPSNVAVSQGGRRERWPDGPWEEPRRPMNSGALTASWTFPFLPIIHSRLREGVKCHHLLLVLKETLAPYLGQREFPHVQEHMTDRAARESTRHEVTDSKQHSPVMQSARPAVLRTSWGESAESAESAEGSNTSYYDSVSSVNIS